MDYTVAAGDCLSSIAKRFGFADWRVIYDHPNNAEFRAARPDPNVIFEGDALYIPERELKALASATGRRATFRVKRGGGARLRMKLVDMDGEPFVSMKYELSVDGEVREGATDGDGMLDERIPEDAHTAELLLPDRGIRRVLALGKLDPVEKVSGYQARLKNLGYDCGPVDGIDGPMTKRGVKAFQADNPPLAVDGICGPKTQAELAAQYGC